MIYATLTAIEIITLNIRSDAYCKGNPSKWHIKMLPDSIIVIVNSKLRTN